MASIIVKWLDKGVHFGKEDSVKRKFIIEEGELEPGQKVTIQLSSRKGSKPKFGTPKLFPMLKRIQDQESQ